MAQDAMVDSSLRYQELTKCELHLPAFAVCGIRALQSDVQQFRQYNVLRQLQLFSLDRSRVEGMPLQERAIRSIFHIVESNQFFYLHPK